MEFNVKFGYIPAFNLENTGGIVNQNEMKTGDMNLKANDYRHALEIAFDCLSKYFREEIRKPVHCIVIFEIKRGISRPGIQLMN